MTIESQGEKANITLDARDRAGNFLNSYQIETNIVSPNGEAQAVTFTQVAPGRYESTFTPKEQGVYLIHFSGKTDAGGGSASFAETTGWALSYSPEYQRIESDPDLLLRLSAIAGGELVSPTPATVFTHDLKATRASRPVAPLLLLIAALLLPFDIAARRLIITKHDLLLLREWLVEKIRSRKITQTQTAQTSPRMEALFQAKGRVRESKKSSAQSPVERATSEHRLSSRHESQKPVEAPAQEMPIETGPAPSPGKEAQGIPPKPEQAPSTTSALLARKKKHRK
jgi:hypothetical protein